MKPSIYHYDFARDVHQRIRGGKVEAQVTSEMLSTIGKASQEMVALFRQASFNLARFFEDFNRAWNREIARNQARAFVPRSVWAARAEAAVEAEPHGGIGMQAMMDSLPSPLREDAP